MGRRPRSAKLVFATSLALLLVVGSSVGSTPSSLAQACGGILGPPCPPPPTPTPAATATPRPTAAPTPTGIPVPGQTPKPTKKPANTAKPSTEPTPGDQAPTDDLPAGLEEQPSSLVVPSIPRTRARNTVELVRALRGLTEWGIPLEQVLVEGMGRFPVAGLAYYRDDWLNPRFTPVPHLHKGLDIFADFGTPVRSPDRGVLTFSNGPTGGIGAYVRGESGDVYYFAHLAERAEGLRQGQRVDIGTVIGYVGDTGNAQGGAPHLHFEIRRPGPVPPKPSVDQWLDEAIELAPQFVKARSQQIEAAREGAREKAADAGVPEGDLEASMLLTLLDPVGGSVGLLPRLDLEQKKHSLVSDRLLAELIRSRVDGYLLLPESRGIHVTD
jgi:murein DD-endopeptidase MepM/ murein hydrolase activator NlpD